ncbi:MAG: hypothetical protein J6T62_06240 [Fibrobacter sp.]|nr:hypothetical protein [Fibrobacter sp.]
MGYLNTYLDRIPNVDISKYAIENTTYSNFYYYWRDEFFSRLMRFFNEKTGIVPTKEIEVRLMFAGHCGVSDLYDGVPTAFWGTFNGVSKYFDDLPYYCVNSPVWSKNLKRGTEVIVIDNNTLRNPTYDIVHHYAILLAHCEMTIVNTLINARMSGGVPVATTEKQKKSIKEFLGKIVNGKMDVVTDIGNLGIEYVGTHTSTAQTIEGLYNTRERLISAFMQDVGFKPALDKRSNTVADEVNAITPQLLVNLKDMRDSRARCYEECAKLFGGEWYCELNEDIDYENMFTKEEADNVQSD